jgi:hypothetical protein
VNHYCWYGEDRACKTEAPPTKCDTVTCNTAQGMSAWSNKYCGGVGMGACDSSTCCKYVIDCGS